VNAKDVVGFAFLTIGLAVSALAWSTLFLPDPIALKVLEVLAVAAFSVLGGVVAWIGLQLLRSPPPKPVEELERELREEIDTIRKEVLEKLRGSTRD